MLYIQTELLLFWPDILAVSNRVYRGCCKYFSMVLTIVTVNLHACMGVTAAWLEICLQYI